jgi:hypothetical protein
MTDGKKCRGKCLDVTIRGKKQPNRKEKETAQLRRQFLLLTNYYYNPQIKKGHTVRLLTGC